MLAVIHRLFKVGWLAAYDGHADVPPAHMGAIDKTSVAVLVEEILEGGKDAFQTRRQKYGF